MKYKLTSESASSLLYLGMRFFKDEKGKPQCVMHDRAVDYPVRIIRYPHVTTVEAAQDLFLLVRPGFLGFMDVRMEGPTQAFVDMVRRNIMFFIGTMSNVVAYVPWAPT